MGLFSKDYRMTVLKRGRWALRVAGAIGAYALIRITFTKAIEDFSARDSGWGYSVLLFGVTLLGVVSAEIAIDWLMGRLIKKLESQE